MMYRPDPPGPEVQGTLPFTDNGITVSQVNAYHPDYEFVAEDWQRMAVLYEGGFQIKKMAASFLIRRPRELQEVYFKRVEHFSYHNILGTVFGWYHAALFKNPPIVQIGLVDDIGQPSGQLDPKLNAFYNAFRKNCDRKRTTLVELTRDLWNSLALYSKGYVLVDLPKQDETAGSLYEQKQTGVIDGSGKPVPHLVSYSPLDVINWSVDQYGILQWAVLRIEESRADFMGKRSMFDVWIYFDRTGFKRYERERKSSETNLRYVDGGQIVTLVSEGEHALSKAGIVPLLQFEVPSSLWLANRAYLPITDHLNQDNAYGWALYMANLAMPVIITDDDVQPTLSEAGFIRLSSGSSYTWSEPEGKSFLHASKRVEELRQECFRLMYLIYQGRTSNATADGASGSSKEMDMMPAQDVMNEFGDVIVAATQRLLDMVAMARGDENVRADVRGMKFGKTATLEEIQKCEAVLALAIPSDTFEREVKKQAAAMYLPDANPETLEQIMKEIQTAPSMQAQMQAAAQKQLEAYQTGIQTSLNEFVAAPPPPTPTTARVSKRTQKVLNN